MKTCTVIYNYVRSICFLLLAIKVYRLSRVVIDIPFGQLRWRSWLRHCATILKVMGSIPDGITGIFHWHNPSNLTVALGSTQLEYQKYFLVVKAAGASAWQPYHLHVPIVLKSGSLNLLEPSGPVQACNGIALFLITFLFTYPSQLQAVPSAWIFLDTNFYS
jgi:hypothetical protein